MSYSIFNIKNHKLNAESFREILSFASDDFCGIIRPSKDTSLVDGIIRSGNDWIWNPEINTNKLLFIGGGCLIQGDLNESHQIDTTHNFWYLDVNLDNTYSNILSDISDNISVKSTQYQTINTSSSNPGIRIAFTDEDGNNISIHYNGFTNWIGEHNNRFIIPLCWLDHDNNLNSIVQVRSKSSFEEYLSVQALEQLWQDIHNTFVHQSGSTSANPTYGKLGNFNFNDSKIKHNNKGFISAADDGVLKLDSYTKGALLIENHEVKSGLLPILYGGTGASSRADAKIKLGIYYGTELPNKHNFNNISVKSGDIYFRILND